MTCDTQSKICPMIKPTVLQTPQQIRPKYGGKIGVVGELFDVELSGILGNVEKVAKLSEPCRELGTSYTEFRLILFQSSLSLAGLYVERETEQEPVHDEHLHSTKQNTHFRFQRDWTGAKKIDFPVSKRQDKLSCILHEMEKKQHECILMQQAEAQRLEKERLATEKREKERQQQFELERLERERQQQLTATAADAARIAKEKADKESREKQLASSITNQGLANKNITNTNVPLINISTPDANSRDVVDHSTNVPLDVHQAFSTVKVYEKILESSPYIAFIESKDPQVVQVRSEIFMRTGSVRNGVSGTQSQLSKLFMKMDELRKALTSIRVLGDDVFQELLNHEDETKLLGDPTTINLATFHFYKRLSFVLVENAEVQMQNLSSSVWTYAHFLQVLWKKWPITFNVLFNALLFKKSIWLIPWSQTVINKKKVLEKDLSKIGSLFCLRLAIYVCLQDKDSVWTLMARLVNRVTDNINDIQCIFILEAAMSVATHCLSTAFSNQFAKVAILIRANLLPKILQRLNMPDTPKEARIPFCRLENLLMDLEKYNYRMEHPPEGYILVRQEATLDDNI